MAARKNSKFRIQRKYCRAVILWQPFLHYGNFMAKIVPKGKESKTIKKYASGG